MIIFHLSKLWKTKFFIPCDAIFLVRMKEKFGMDHYWEWRVNIHEESTNVSEHTSSFCTILKKSPFWKISTGIPDLFIWGHTNSNTDSNRARSSRSRGYRLWSKRFSSINAGIRWLFEFWPRGARAKTWARGEEMRGFLLLLPHRQFFCARLNSRSVKTQRLRETLASQATWARAHPFYQIAASFRRLQKYEFDRIQCLFWNHARGGIQSACYATYCFANCPIVFSGRAWLINGAGCRSSTLRSRWPAASRSFGRFRPSIPANAPHTPPEPWRHSDVCRTYGRALTAERRHAGSISSGLPRGAAVADRRICSSGIPYSATLTERSSLTTLKRGSERIEQVDVLSCDCTNWK